MVEVEDGRVEGPPPLYGRLMKAIRKGHSVGNTIRMFKLPLVFTEEALYADAIAQFYLVTAKLEEVMGRFEGSSGMLSRVKELGLRCAPGYASDLEELNGAAWRDQAERSMTAATRAYCDVLESSGEVELTAAAFILYGALVVGGGKSTQAKVRKIFPRCSHKLYDVGGDMKALRADYRRTFTDIGKRWPEHFVRLEEQAARFMALNNTVVVSIRCWGKYCNVAASVAVALAAGAALAWSKR
ncbi:hypothetical protein HOP50_06g45330 [Chloropicon primus]|uniref:Heme oxygenase n=1 Tax=Chloropicon primus TaxID=1764295 RepID=A0A5B8MRU3_9CHLO|nr:hypothetical protein A3770_06p45100 [Chloropicon primus]UPR01212.1 hypothetical protein HOP50_06g45330 [Chloropicon primus]|eukprot:QDZ21992.1 hypothetical protein A3770_06p45100 [Chloropicon primus]